MATQNWYQKNDDERRDNVERRECQYTYCIPERRAGVDRRKKQG